MKEKEMKWTVLAAKLFQAINSGDKETEQRLYAIMDEKKAKKKAKKESKLKKQSTDVHAV
jgi:hypothetical protein